jgi:phospholipid/cholesterol/gamma-HCH transport system substrate-binding protein
MDTSLTERLKTRIAGLLALLFVVGALWTAYAAYNKEFIDTQTVYVTSNRAGLLLDKGAAVKAFGLAIGDVRNVQLVGPNKVRITLAIDTDQLKDIPADAAADISGTTVFGPKFVSLMYDRGASAAAAVQAGQTLPVVDVGSEINDAFQSITNVVQAINPTELNQTLTAVATALQGRGKELGDLLANSEEYVKALNGETGSINADIAQSRDVFDIYTDTAPELLSIAQTASVTSRTLLEKRGALNSALISLIAASQSGTDLLKSTSGPLHDLLERLNPVLSLTSAFAPVLTCTLKAFAIQSTDFAKAMGAGPYPGVTGVATFIPAGSPYTYPANLPKFLKTNAPTCYGLPLGRANPPHYQFPDGTADVYTKGGGVGLSKDPVDIYLGLVKDFFGDSGLAQLLKPEPTTPKKKAGSR